MTPEHAHAKKAHESLVRLRALVWAHRDELRRASPELWRELCREVADATDHAGKAMDLTAGRAATPMDEMDAEEVREMVREAQWAAGQ